MNVRVLALMSTQWGLVTRSQALESGMSAAHIDLLVRDKTWAAVRRGVYARSAFIAQLANERDRRLVADRATSLTITRPHVLSHHSAAYVLGLEVLYARPAVTHVTRPGIVGSHCRRAVHHHRAPYLNDDVVHRGGVAVLATARTALDITRELGFRHGLVAADSALRSGATRADLREVRSRMRSWPNATIMDDVIASASPLSDSPGESLARILIASLGYGVPEQQFGLTADGRTVWCDLRLGRHVFEFDGRLKYHEAETGGVASLPAGEVLWQEKKRQDFVTSFKLGVSRLVWEDLLERNWTRTAERLRREYRHSCELFGTSIDDLAGHRPRGVRPRPTPAEVRWPTAA